MQKFHLLQTTTLAHIENGIDRYSVVVAFNEHFYQKRTADPSALADIAYNPRVGPRGDIREADALSKLVIDYLAQSKWVATYGLSYLETMELTYAEWIRMQKALNLYNHRDGPSIE
jgi:hypothetical protein